LDNSASIIKDEMLVSNMEDKTNFSRRHRLARTRIVNVFGNHWRGV